MFYTILWLETFETPTLMAIELHELLIGKNEPTPSLGFKEVKEEGRDSEVAINATLSSLPLMKVNYFVLITPCKVMAPGVLIQEHPVI